MFDENAPKVVVMVQARMTSTRLPGKVMLTVEGKPLLGYLIERLKRVRLADELLLVVSTLPTDDPLVDLASQYGVSVERGSELDVLERFYQAAWLHRADIIVRITADCPLLDPRIVDDLIAYYIHKYPRTDYASTCTQQITYPRGMNAEIFSYHALQQANTFAKTDSEREHVTQFIYQHPEWFKLGGIEYAHAASYPDVADYRLTVDTPEDFMLIEKMLQRLLPLHPNFSFEDVLDVIRAEPDLLTINAHVEQKVL